MASSLAYHEPDIVTILIQSSFLLSLNLINSIFDNLLFCGLIGQIFIGVTFGTPGAKWIDESVEEVIVQLGYLGLILLVYEGGLNTNFKALKANLFLSSLVAFTGIAFPIALSFALIPLLNATPLQAFGAGAALCSTSLGTTFTILSANGLEKTRLGTVLSSAAMMDDIVGLVMVQVISNLSGDFQATIVIRPLGVALGFAFLVPLGCWCLRAWARGRKTKSIRMLGKSFKTHHTAFVVHTLVLLGMIAGAGYTGTSNLFTAYLAGAAISWWDGEVAQTDAESTPPTSVIRGSEEVSVGQETALQRHRELTTTGIAVYDKYCASAVQHILKPFFFASIGFAIPIRDMFTANIVWRGIVYTVLMLFGKLITGTWLIRLNISWPKARDPKSVRPLMKASAVCFGWVHRRQKKQKGMPSHELQNKGKKRLKKTTNQEEIAMTSGERMPQSPTSRSNPPPKILKPLSIYPATILGTAMTARGEIGFLIASIAQTTGLFDTSSSGTSEIYLVSIWAIVLCTIIGPLSVGVLVKRIRRLQRAEGADSRINGPLGIWGIP